MGEAWHLGLPPKPDLFDFLQCQAAAVASPESGGETARNVGWHLGPDHMKVMK